jgi:hypothetical protein
MSFSFLRLLYCPRMRKLFAGILFMIGSIACEAQIANDYMVNLHGDLIKTDLDRIFKKAQVGAEFNYFLHKRFTVTGGFEVWTEDEISFVIGTRWYPTDDFFVRVRGLVGMNDVALGAGWTKPLAGNFRFETMGDFYFHGYFAIRAGFSYVFRKKMVSRE